MKGKWAALINEVAKDSKRFNERVKDEKPHYEAAGEAAVAAGRTVGILVGRLDDYRKGALHAFETCARLAAELAACEEQLGAAQDQAERASIENRMAPLIAKWERGRDELRTIIADADSDFATAQAALGKVTLAIPTTLESERTTSVGDTSVGDTSVGDTSVGDTSVGDTRN